MELPFQVIGRDTQWIQTLLLRIWFSWCGLHAQKSLWLITFLSHYYLISSSYLGPIPRPSYRNEDNIVGED